MPYAPTAVEIGLTLALVTAVPVFIHVLFMLLTQRTVNKKLKAELDLTTSVRPPQPSPRRKRIQAKAAMLAKRSDNPHERAVAAQFARKLSKTK